MHTIEELANMRPECRRSVAVVDYVTAVYPAGAEIEAFLAAWDWCYEVTVFARLAQDARAEEQKCDTIPRVKKGE